MAEYKGNSVVVEYNSLDISGQARTVTVNEVADEPEDIDATHKGDSRRNLIEGFPGSEKTDVEVEILDEAGDASNLMSFEINAKDTLIIYPEGKTHTYPKLTVNNARLINRSQNIVYDDVASITAAFHAKNTVTRGTYSTA